MKISQKLAILIKNLYLSKQYGARRLLSECPTRVGNLEASTVCGIESARRVQLSGNQAAVDRIHCGAVDHLVLSQRDKPKKHRSAHEISNETVILCSSVHKIIIHRNHQLKCFKRRCA